MAEKLDSKTPATLAVDVLAVMDNATTIFQEARAAVAELIEADEQLDEAHRQLRLERDSHVEWMSEELSPLRSLRYGELERAEQRRAVAVARVKGESA